MIKQSRHTAKILSILFVCTMLLGGTWSPVYAEDPPAEPTVSTEAAPSPTSEEEAEATPESTPTVTSSPDTPEDEVPAKTEESEDDITQDENSSENVYAKAGNLSAGQDQLMPAAADSDTAANSAAINYFKVSYLEGAEYIQSEDKYYVRPKENDSLLNSIKFSVTYSISGGTSDHAPGSITMTIPAHLFEARDSSEGNRKYGDKCVLPFPSDGYKATINEQDNTVVITNYQSIDRASVLTFDVQYQLTPIGALPSDIRDMTQSTPFKATMSISDEEAPVLTAEDTSPVNIFYDTQVNVSSISKSVYQKTDAWPGGNWGEAPEDADQYFYVVYKILTVCNYSTQPFRVAITDTPQDGGEVVAYLDNDHEIKPGNRVGMDPTFEKQDQFGGMYSYLGTFASTNTMEPYLIQNQVPQGILSTTPPKYGLDKPKESSSGLGSYNSCMTWVLVRYPKKLVSDGKNHKFNNTATATIRGIDNIDQPKEKKADTTYTYKPLQFNAPRGNTFSLQKGTDNGSRLFGAIDQLEHNRPYETYGVRKYFTHDAQVKGYSMTLSENGDRNNPDDYGKRQYTVEFIDDLMAFDKDFEHPLGEGDFEIDSLDFYLSEKDYLPDETKGEYVETLRKNFKNYPRLNLYGRKGDQEWEKIGVLVETGFNDYYNGFSYSKIIPEGSTEAKDSHEVLKRMGYTGIKVSYLSNAYSTRLRGKSYYSVLPSQRVKDYIANKDSVELDNVNTLRVLDADGQIQGFFGNSYGFNSEVVQERDKKLYGNAMYHGAAFMTIERLSRSSTLKKTVGNFGNVSNDTVNKRVVIPYELKAVERIEGPSGYYSDMVKDGYFNPQNEGTFYDLLPLGVDPDPKTIRLSGFYNYDIQNGRYTPKFDYKYEIVQNYKNTGRTLLIVHAKKKDDGKENYYNGKVDTYDSGIVLDFRAYYSYNNISNYGATLLNSAAYETGNDSIGLGSADDGGSLTEKDRLKDLDKDTNPDGMGERFIYDELQHTIDAVTYAELSLVKKVKGGNALSWTDGRDGKVKVPAASSYYYNLYYGPTINTEASNVIVYDSLENYLPEDVSEQWHGTFESIDLSQPIKLGAAPVVYYSTVKNLSVEDHMDLSDASVWSSVKPADNSEIKAIAVDLRKNNDGGDFILSEKKTITIPLTMASPTDQQQVAQLVKDNIYAYNNALLKCDVKNIENNTFEKEKVTKYNFTQIGLTDFECELHKKSDPESGTIDAPAVVKVDDTINYTVSVSNTSKVTRLNDIEIEDIIPDGLTIDFDNIKYYRDGEDPMNAALISSASDVSASRDGQKITFSIRSMTLQDSISFIIPVTVKKDDAVFANTAVMKKLNGIQVNLHSETTYHKAEKSKCNVFYHVAGDDTYGIPEGGSAPDPDQDVPIGADHVLKPHPTTLWTTSEGTTDGIPGKWEFLPESGWSETENDYSSGVTSISQISEDRNVYGKWMFVPDLGTFVIRKTVSGTGLPDKDTEFEFLVTKDGKAASGNYSIDGGEVSPIPETGRIKLKAGQTATLTDLLIGDYQVTETVPSQANYHFTSFSVNGGEAQTGLSATVTVTAGSNAATGGWKTKDGIPVKDDQGYYTYTITADQINQDGTINVDCDPVAEYFISEMQQYQNFASHNFKVKFVNETGAPIQYKDYGFDTVNWIAAGDTYTPSSTPTMKNTNENANAYSAGYGWGEAWQRMYSMLIGQNATAGSLDVTGFDGNLVRIATAPLRCTNPAVISYFNSNPGNGTLTGNRTTDSANKITLLQINAFPELIKQAFTFKNWQGTEISLPEDSNRTYADFLCAFYGVNSLDELTAAQKYNVLGTGSKGSPAMPFDGQSQITTYYSNLAGTVSNWCVPYAALNDGTLSYFKTWGFSDTRIEAGKKLSSGGQVFSQDDVAAYAYQPEYYLLESDPEVLKMAYQYLYERCIRFSLDSNDRPVSTAFDNTSYPVADVGGIKDYLDKTEAASANVLAAMNGGKQVADGESITLDHVQGYIEVPNAWNQFRYFDFGFHLTFETDSVISNAINFTNHYQDASTPAPTPTPAPAPTPVPAVPSTLKPTVKALVPKTGSNVAPQSDSETVDAESRK